MTTYKHATATMKVKAVGAKDGLSDGQFTAYASVFDNVDWYGDVVVKGAFAQSLADWAAKGDPIPLLWGHDLSDPESNIGTVVKAVEDDHGLLVTCQLDDDVATPGTRTAKVYQLLKGRRVTKMSFAYDVVAAHSETLDGKDVNVLTQLNLHEVSVVPVPANPEAGVLAVKGMADVAAQLADVVKSVNAAVSAVHQALAKAGLDLPADDTPTAVETADADPQTPETPRPGDSDDQADATSDGDADDPDEAATGSKSAGQPSPRPSSDHLARALAIASAQIPTDERHDR